MRSDAPGHRGQVALDPASPAAVSSVGRTRRCSPALSRAIAPRLSPLRMLIAARSPTANVIRFVLCMIVPVVRHAHEHDGLQVVGPAPLGPDKDRSALGLGASGRCRPRTPAAGRGRSRRTAPYRRRRSRRRQSERLSAAVRFESEGWSGRRGSNPRHAAWKAGTAMRNSTVLRGPSETCPVIVSSQGGVTTPSWAPRIDRPGPMNELTPRRAGR
jgi:hypothetical protein